MVNEQEIRLQVEQSLKGSLGVRVEPTWFTPSGRERKTPMYEAFIENAYLKTKKAVRGQVESEVRDRAREQLTKWAEIEVRGRFADATDDAKQRAEEDTRLAQEELDALRKILSATIAVDDRIDWAKLEDHRAFPPMPDQMPFSCTPQPSLAKRRLIEWLAPSLWRKRVKQWEQEKARWTESRADALLAHELVCAQMRRQYESKRQAFLDRQTEHNSKLAAFRKAFEAGSPEQVEEYVRNVFDRSVYPASFRRDYRVAYQSETTTVIVDVDLPSQDQLPNVVEYRYNARQRTVVKIEMKPKDQDALYDGSVKQCILRTIHEVFESVYLPTVQAVVVNGWVTNVDTSTGQDRTTCVASVHATRQPFEAINLARIDASECLKSLKCITAGPLSQVAPVQPILQFDRNDRRFVAGRAVLDELGSDTNLAEMPWEEFEHLVRELFGRMFSTAGAEVRITQASSDGGVDAVAYDPDPIRGGKFVIQAKRYTRVVPVSAVRDLYGTMTHENASKGLLVTTAHFGRDSREFAKDKPLTLIDGANLVYLLEQHGYHVRLDVDQARRNARL